MPCFAIVASMPDRSGSRSRRRSPPRRRRPQGRTRSALPRACAFPSPRLAIQGLHMLGAGPTRPENRPEYLATRSCESSYNWRRASRFPGGEPYSPHFGARRTPGRGAISAALRFIQPGVRRRIGPGALNSASNQPQGNTRCSPGSSFPRWPALPWPPPALSHRRRHPRRRLRHR